MDSFPKNMQRNMRRRQRLRPAEVVDNIKADDGPDTLALFARMKEAGFHYWSRTPGLKYKPSKRRKVSTRIPVYYVILAEELARRQGMSAEDFMSQILAEGLLEAFMEVDAQKRAAVFLAKGIA